VTTTRLDDGIPTTQVIAPGSACPSNHFLAASLDAVDDDLLSITSANRYGFGLVLGPHARQRLVQRRYDDVGAA